VTEIVTVQPENGNGNGAAQLLSAGKSGFQKRVDKLTREKYELRQENDQLRLAIHGYEEMIRKYKTALLATRRQHAE